MTGLRSGAPQLQILVLAKEPVPGRVKTRLCPPCTPAQAAAVAAAALADTLDAVTATPAPRRTLVLDGRLPSPGPGWRTVAQRGDGLDERLAHAFADTESWDTGALLIGMDTPQVTPALLGSIAAVLEDPPSDAALGLAEDGGWWALALRDCRHAQALLGVPTSTPDTGALTLAALRARGLRVAMLPVLRDIDTAADARAVAAAHPHGRFAEAVRAHVPQPVPADLRVTS